MGLPVITLYSRKKCHLCEDALEVINDLQSEYEFTLNVVDIDTDDELTELYGLTIPVVLIDGDEVQYGHVDKNVIRKRLHEK